MKTNKIWVAAATAILLAFSVGGCKEDDYTEIVFVCPVVQSTSPGNLAGNVLPLDRTVTATFNTPMDPATISQASFTLQEGILSTSPVVAGSLNYNGSNATLSFTPADSLKEDAVYTATIQSTVTDLSGTPLQEDYVWIFSTGATLGPDGVFLNTVARFGIIAGVGVSNNAGFSVINDLDVGIYPGVRSSIVGFPPAVVVNGDIYASDDIAPPGIAAMLLQAKDDLTAVYLYAEGATAPAPTTVSGDQGGKTLYPGIYKSTSTLSIQAGNLTLDALGETDAVWIFQIASGFTTVGGGTFPSSTGGNVILTGGAQAKNIYWQVASSATIGDYTSFKGNILALQSITMGAYSQAEGRMLARNGSVSLTSTNIINRP